MQEVRILHQAFVERNQPVDKHILLERTAIALREAGETLEQLSQELGTPIRVFDTPDPIRLEMEELKRRVELLERHLPSVKGFGP
jgi:hypothetical protein